MGKHGSFVWFAYGVTLLGMLLLFVWSWFGARARDSELEKVRQWARAERKGPSTATLSTSPVSRVDRQESQGLAPGPSAIQAKGGEA